MQIRAGTWITTQGRASSGFSSKDFQQGFKQSFRMAECNHTLVSTLDRCLSRFICMQHRMSDSDCTWLVHSLTILQNDLILHFIWQSNCKFKLRLSDGDSAWLWKFVRVCVLRGLTVNADMDIAVKLLPHQQKSFFVWFDGIGRKTITANQRAWRRKASAITTTRCRSSNFINASNSGTHNAPFPGILWTF